ncbi:MAG: ankyrin repeat domain-containing protein [bacterium]|nr:ankyrin repeat domain-containing protein [bacterium]
MIRKPAKTFNTVAPATLHSAVASNDMKAVERFLLKLTQVNRRDALGRTPLMIAARHGLPGMTQFLLTNGADVHAVDNEGLTALNHVFPPEKFAQARTTEPFVVGILLGHGADASAILRGPENIARPENIALVVGEIITRGMTSTLRGMIDKGLDVTLNDKGDAPFLVAATDTGNEAMVALLLASGGRINAAGASGRTALWAAIASEDVDLVNMVLDAGADTRATAWKQVSGKQMSDLEYSRMSTPEISAAVSAAARKFEVNQAAFTGDAAKLEELLKDRVPMETVDMHGYTPLQHAIRESHLDAVKVLIKYGALLNNPGVGELPLHAAIRKGEAEVVRALLEAGASAILKSYSGKDALDIAQKIKKKTMLHLVEPYYAHEKGVAVKQAIGLNGSVAAPQTARFRKAPTP